MPETTVPTYSPMDTLSRTAYLSRTTAGRLGSDLDESRPQVEWVGNDAAPADARPVALAGAVSAADETPGRRLTTTVRPGVQAGIILPPPLPVPDPLEMWLLAKAFIELVEWLREKRKRRFAELTAMLLEALERSQEALRDSPMSETMEQKILWLKDPEVLAMLEALYLDTSATEESVIALLLYDTSWLLCPTDTDQYISDVLDVLIGNVNRLLNNPAAGTFEEREKWRAEAESLEALKAALVASAVLHRTPR